MKFLSVVLGFCAVLGLAACGGGGGGGGSASSAAPVSHAGGVATTGSVSVVTAK